eukprot:5564853-Pleurochrysis_carterae.AAC.1
MHARSGFALAARTPARSASRAEAHLAQVLPGCSCRARNLSNARRRRENPLRKAARAAFAHHTSTPQLGLANAQCADLAREQTLCFIRA